MSYLFEFTKEKLEKIAVLFIFSGFIYYLLSYSPLEPEDKILAAIYSEDSEGVANVLSELSSEEAQRLVILDYDDNPILGATLYRISKGRFPSSEQGSYYEIVEHLIRSGVGINAQVQAWEMAPIHMTLTMRDLHLTELLLENGADPNVEDSDKRTAIFYLPKPGFTFSDSQRKTYEEFLDVVIPLMVKEGAKLDHKDRRGRCAADFGDGLNGESIGVDDYLYLVLRRNGMQDGTCRG